MRTLEKTFLLQQLMLPFTFRGFWLTTFFYGKTENPRKVASHSGLMRTNNLEVASKIFLFNDPDLAPPHREAFITFYFFLQYFFLESVLNKVIPTSKVKGVVCHTRG